MKLTATQRDIDHLERLYQDRTACFGDAHVHSASSPFSDGKHTLYDLKAHLAENQMHFATVVDHRQVLHMWHEDWDDTVFIGGSEPSLTVTGTEVISRENIDYEMVFTKPEGLEAVLNAFPEDYDYGFQHGRFRERFRGDHGKIARLIQCIKDNGGMFIYPHPLGREGYYDPVDPMHRWFADETGFEVINKLNGDTTSEQNAGAYRCWVELLNAGKRIWATCGSDAHGGWPRPATLVTLYAAEKNACGYFDQMRIGNMTAGPVGVRTVVGDAATGSVGSFAGKRVVMAVGDFHPQAVEPAHTYRVDIYDETGVIASQELNTAEMNYFAFDARSDALYYRANVYDVTEDKIIAIGNPVWNKR